MEQDRKDAIPSVLNDLIDVDGTPTDGEGLSFSDGAWRPGPAPGLLPEYGPVLNILEGTYSGSNLADAAAVGNAWGDMEMAAGFYATYPGTHPLLGTWSRNGSGQKRWTPNEPGIYTVYSLMALKADTYASGGLTAMAPPMSVIGQFTWGSDFSSIHYVGQTFGARQTSNLTLHVSQGMIDGGYAGFWVSVPQYIYVGAERVNYLNLLVVIERHSPGSTFDYYADI